jgi:hypothetical protein
MLYKGRYRILRRMITIIEVFTFGIKVIPLRRWFVKYYLKHEM